MHTPSLPTSAFPARRTTQRFKKGAPADLIRLDPHAPFVVDPAKLHSRCRNTPFDEARLQGVVKLTLVGGGVVFGDARG